MASIWAAVLVSAIVAFTAVPNIANSAELKKKEEAVPVELHSRFFDLGGIFSQLFPDLNHGSQGGFQGSQGGFARNPNEMDFPTNSQIYPPVAQGQHPEFPVGQGSTWPVIDDAKLYPNQRPISGGGQQNQNPSNGNLGGSQPVQYPNGGNFGGSPSSQYPNGGNFGGSQPNQYPNGGNFGGSQPNQYPNGGNFGGSQSSQYPNGGNLGGSQPGQNQYPNDNDFGASQYPNQGHFGGAQYPDQGDFTNSGNQNNFRPGSGQSGEGTLDNIVPPQTWNPGNAQNRPPIQNPGQDDDQFGNNSGDETTAILGRPVQVPQMNAPPDQISFPSSTDNPSQRQCVQDCQSTSEYSPVCGTNNVTYFNPGKFVCARNCGINVFVARQGRCLNDTPFKHGL